MATLHFEPIAPAEHEERMLNLLAQLNPAMSEQRLKRTQLEMVNTPNYTCFGLFLNGALIGISSGWTTVRIYCGKQLELDNVIIDQTLQSKGYGKFFMSAIKEWSLNHGYHSIGLNTYVQNSRSHKFYFNEGFRILGFHFENRISTNA